jgi:multimeric flavodoxin WrbA
MKIVCLLGSPRPQGNSSTIANHFLREAAKHGARVQTFDLHQLDYSGCKACYVCKRPPGKCCVDDDLIPVLEAIPGADILVISTPIYFDGFNYKVSAFLERTNSYFQVDEQTSAFNSRLAPGKKLVFIQAQGRPGSARKDLSPQFTQYFDWLGFEDKYLIYACGVDSPGDIKARDDVLLLAEETARNIVFSLPPAQLKHRSTSKNRERKKLN